MLADFGAEVGLPKSLQCGEIEQGRLFGPQSALLSQATGLGLEILEAGGSFETDSFEKRVVSIADVSAREVGVLLARTISPRRDIGDTLPEVC